MWIHTNRTSRLHPELTQDTSFTEGRARTQDVDTVYQRVQRAELESIQSWQPVLPHVQVTARTVTCRALIFDNNRAPKAVLSTSIASRFEGSPQPTLGVDAISG